MCQMLVWIMLFGAIALAQPPRPYPAHWWAAVPEEQKAVWEILPQAAKPGEVILSKRNELGVLSNFAATPFTLRGRRYASVEGFWHMMLYPENAHDLGQRRLESFGRIHAMRSRA